MRTKFPREFYIPKNSRPVTDEQSACVAYIYERPGTTYGFLAAVFGGKRSKPDWHHSYRTAEARDKAVEDYFQGQRESLAIRAKWREEHRQDNCRTVEEVFALAVASANKSSDGAAWLAPKHVATILRCILPRQFPGVQFRVTTDTYSMGDHVDVRWADGPEWKTLQDFCRNYSFKGFDGMIDMGYSMTRWLAPDGTMSIAHSPGTGQSSGSDPEIIGSPHHPAAIQVNGGTDYVFCYREESKAGDTIGLGRVSRA